MGADKLHNISPLVSEGLATSFNVYSPSYVLVGFWDLFVFPNTRNEVACYNQSVTDLCKTLVKHQVELLQRAPRLGLRVRASAWRATESCIWQAECLSPSRPRYRSTSPIPATVFSKRWKRLQLLHIERILIPLVSVTLSLYISFFASKSC